MLKFLLNSMHITNCLLIIFVSQMERKLTVNFEETRTKKKKQRYRDKEKMFGKYWKRHVVILMRERWRKRKGESW